MFNNCISPAYKAIIYIFFRVINLSLRYNQITDKGAGLIGRALGTPQTSNQKLVSINLSGNQIGDQGTEHIANVGIDR